MRIPAQATSILIGLARFSTPLTAHNHADVDQGHDREQRQHNHEGERCPKHGKPDCERRATHQPEQGQPQSKRQCAAGGSSTTYPGCRIVVSQQSPTIPGPLVQAPVTPISGGHCRSLALRRCSSRWKGTQACFMLLTCYSAETFSVRPVTHRSLEGEGRCVDDALAGGTRSLPVNLPVNDPVHTTTDLDVPGRALRLDGRRTGSRIWVRDEEVAGSNPVTPTSKAPSQRSIDVANVHRTSGSWSSDSCVSKSGVNAVGVILVPGVAGPRCWHAALSATCPTLGSARSHRSTAVSGGASISP